MATLPHTAYADAVIAELEQRLAHAFPQGELPELRSVFFGGGTPSLWAPSQLGRVLSAIKAHWNYDDSLEITVECNPTSVDHEHFEQLLLAGVNRVSIGVQGLDHERLQFLGRLHDEAGGLKAVRTALEVGVPRVSADLIYGVFKQDPKAAVRDVSTVAELGVHHLSAYALTIEPGTRFGAQHAQGKLPLLEDSLVAQSITDVSAALRALGFEHYEISNFARGAEQRSVHNMGYWYGRDYLGLGTGAYGTVQLPSETAQGERVRYKNLLSPERYMQAFSEQQPDPFEAPLAEREVIDGNTAIDEALLLGLRIVDGVDLDEVAALRGGVAYPPERAAAVARLVAQGKLQREGGRLVLPREQWLFADALIVDLL